MIRKALKIGTGVLGIAFIIAQFIQPDRTNPPADPSASFEALAKPAAHVAAAIGRSCHDCHSNQTVWPWYSRVAPISWLVASDVNEGRAKLNFSQWNIYSPEMVHIKMRQICREVQSGDMPPAYYLPMHPGAKLTAADVSAICSAGSLPTRNQPGL